MAFFDFQGLADPLANALDSYSSYSVKNHLLDYNVVYETNAHLNTGVLGAKFLLEVLSGPAFGHIDLAWTVATQPDYPGWGYMVASGATAVWELWQDMDTNGMNSHNQPMLSSVGAWLYKRVAGIQPSLLFPGYQAVSLAPKVWQDCTNVTATVSTMAGAVSVSARLYSAVPPAGCFPVVLVQVAASVPLGVTQGASVCLPLQQFADPGTVLVAEGPSWATATVVYTQGRFKAGAPGVRSALYVAGKYPCVLVALGSGNFEFFMWND